MLAALVASALDRIVSGEELAGTFRHCPVDVPSVESSRSDQPFCPATGSFIVDKACLPSDKLASPSAFMVNEYPPSIPFVRTELSI